MRYFRVTAFEQYKHYGDRRKLRWLKWPIDIIGNRKFIKLTERQRYHVLGLYCLAGRYGNHLEDDQKWLRAELHVDSNIDLERLAAAGYIEWIQEVVDDPASNVVANGYQTASLDKDKEKEEEQNPFDFGPETTNGHDPQRQPLKRLAK